MSILVAVVATARGMDSVTPLTLRIDPPTHHAAGFVVDIEGDDDGDASAIPYFRKQGTADWSIGLPFLRVENRDLNGVAPGNILAGSLFDLEADGAYEVRVDIQDPDGGGAELTTDVRTRAVPSPTDLTRLRFVSPGTGGGSGTKSDPFLGLEAAEAEAVPGDVFVLLEGDYPAHAFEVDGAVGAPITWRGFDRDRVVVRPDDGAALWLDGRQHLVLENFSIAGTDAGIHAASVNDLVFRHLQLTIDRRSGDPYGIYVGGTDCTICDNTLVGPEADWTDREEDSYAIQVGGTGHVVCSNQITQFWDGIDLNAAEAPQSWAIDIVGNDIRNGTDDGIETDSGLRNIRVVGNRIANTLKGVSAQPVYGGPVYILRNEVYNTLSSPYKFHVDPSGLIVLHNSTVSADSAFSDGEWSNAIFRNNVLYGAQGYVMETVGALEDMDYDAWSPKQDPVLKFNKVRYDTINASCGDLSATGDFCAQTGNGVHDVLYEREDLWPALPEPPGGESTPEPGDWDFTLRAGSVAVDAGVALPNVNDCWLGSLPDLGARELGAPDPAFGPREDWEEPAWSPPCGSPEGPGDTGTGEPGRPDTGDASTGERDTGPGPAVEVSGGAPSGPGGCGCASSSGRHMAVLLGMSLGLVVRRRR